jgi:hypothetical protein
MIVLLSQALRLICSVALSLRVSMGFRMSSTFQAVIRGPSLKPLGNRPAVMPAHQVDRETGTRIVLRGVAYILRSESLVFFRLHSFVLSFSVNRLPEPNTF